jgi:hypothetical protein
VLKNLHRSSIYDVIKILMLGDLFVSFCRLAHGRFGMMFELKPLASLFFFVRHMSYARIQIRGDYTPSCGTPLSWIKLSNGLYAVRASSFLFLIKCMQISITFCRTAILLRDISI